MLAIIAISFFVAVVLMGWALSTSLGERDEARATLRDRLDKQTGVVSEFETGDVVLDRRLSSIQALNRILESSSFVRRLALLMRQAGLRRRVGEVILFIPLLGSLGVLAGMLLTDSPVIAAAFGGMGLFVPMMIINRMRKQRVAKFAEQLPDALDLIKAALQAGHSFLTSLKVVADDFPDPIAQELDTVAEEIRHGLPTREALLGLQERVPDENLPMFIVGVLVVQESGGNLVEVLENVSHTVRERFKLLRDVETMTAQGRLSGILLSCLPVAVGILLYFILPGYFEAMLSKSAGHYMLAYCAVSIITGHLVIQRIVQIKV